MCYLCSCVSSLLDGIQRVVTFGLACWLCYALCIGMIVASIAGIAYGYNYCMAEFLTLTSRSEVTVFMRRGKFYDPPDIKSPLVHGSGRRSTDFEQELNANMSTDYDDSLRRARNAATKSLGDAWVKSDDTRRYAERLTKFSDNVDSNDVVMMSVHVTASATMEGVRRENADDAGKYSANVMSYSSKINAGDDAERAKTISPPSTIESKWKFPELLSKVEKAGMVMNAFTPASSDERKFGEYIDKPFAEQFPGANKLVVEDTPLPTTTVDTRYRTNVDNSWQFAEQLSKFVEGKKVDKADNGVVKVETPAFFKPTRTPGLSEFDKDEMAVTRGAGYLNFLKPLRTTSSRKTSEELNYTKGRMSSRRPTQKRPDSKIKFVERKHQDSKATLAPMRHWATRSTTKGSSEEYSSSEEDDEDIVYKSV